MRVFVLVSVASLATGLVCACAGDAEDDLTAGDGGVDARASGDASDPTGDDDAGDPGDPDAGGDPGAKDGGATKDADGPGQGGDPCAFNRDCAAALRCECDEMTGCACEPGARGTGKNGVDACDDGNDCESAVCVEGPTNGTFVCSDECASEADCTGQLPQCLSIPALFPVPICVRKAP